MRMDAITFSSWRFWLVLLVLLFATGILVVRMADLTFFRRDFLRHEGDMRAVRQLGTPVQRGMILDRQGAVLAASAPVWSLWVDPSHFHPAQAELQTLAQAARMPVSQLRKRLDAAHGRFVWLRRGLSPDVAAAIRSTGIHDLGLQVEYRRFYPEGSVTAHVLGLTGEGDRGLEGLEKVYDAWLAGKPARREVLRDRTGRVVNTLKVLETGMPGHNLVLSLDRRIQFLAFQALSEGIGKNLAVSGSAIVLDVNTGEILAMANQPAFNPNHLLPGEQAHVRNRAVTDSFEPGSTIKTFSVAAALESGRFQPESRINTWPGWMRTGHNLVRDEKLHGELDLTGILQVSSNVGIAKIMLGLPSGLLPALLQRLGFGEATASGFPGEQTGHLPLANDWKPFALATLSFGYGISVTALQLASAYAVLAHQGVRLPVTLLRTEPGVSLPGQRVISERTADQMLRMLQAVVSAGTGAAGKISGYTVAGKTGTAWVAGKQGYASKHRYTSSFVGIAPASHPRLVVAVVIHEPGGEQYSGARVSAPVFGKIMQGALRILNVRPEKQTAQR